MSDSLEQPSGNSRLRTTVSAHVMIVGPSAAGGSGERILLARLAYRDHRSGKWSFPGGYVDHGETLEQALKREVAEEIGLGLGQCRQVETIPVLQVDCPNVGFLFLCEEWSGVPASRSREILEIAWVDEPTFRQLDRDGQLAYPQMSRQTTWLGWQNH